MFTRTVILTAIGLINVACSVPVRTATVPVPEEDLTGPRITSATFSVLGFGGAIHDLDEVSRAERIHVDHAVVLNFIAQDLESGVRSISWTANFLFWCGSVGFGPERRWRIGASNTLAPAGHGEAVRVTAGADRTFKLSDAYNETDCPNPPPRYQDLRGTISVTATNFVGVSTSREYEFTIVPVAR